MNLTPYSDSAITGFSRSAQATFVRHRGADVVFDMGECPDDLVDVNTVFLSHTHLDHAMGLARYLKMHDSGTPTIYVPAASFYAVASLVGAMSALNSEPGSFNPIIVPVEVGHVATFRRGNATFNVSAFAVDHRVASVGYRMERVTPKLRPDLVDAGPDVLKAIKSRGEAVTVPTVTERFTFIGDSTCKPLRDNPAILDCDTLVMEATYLARDYAAMAQEYGHTCLPDLADVLRAAPKCPTVYVKHFSLRYTHPEIHAAVDALKAEGLPVIAMIGKE